MWTKLLIVAALLLPTVYAQSAPKLHEKRRSPLDLEVSGSLAGLPRGSTRFITRDELLAMPQVTFTVNDDSNFAAPTKIEGVSLDVLAKSIASVDASDLVVAICDDGYRANYPREYAAAHHPVLVLTVNGQHPAGWPKAADDHSASMGPFMISHPRFTPSFKVLSHVDEAQIPWGVVRLEFRNESMVFGAIAPRGTQAQKPAVQAGFRIAQQNCFRCHNNGNEGGQKSGISWKRLSASAAKSPRDFAAYIRNPAETNPKAQMPPNSEYDDATLNALTAYFKTFSEK